MVDVDIPDEEIDGEPYQDDTSKPVRESFMILAGLAKIGAIMGFKFWLPISDRTRLISELNDETKSALLEEMPISYDEATTKTIKNIVVLWLKSRTVIGVLR